jgi:hypothetical protein
MAVNGFPRYPKMHPCGIVLPRAPMDNGDEYRDACCLHQMCTISKS